MVDVGRFLGLLALEAWHSRVSDWADRTADGHAYGTATDYLFPEGGHLLLFLFFYDDDCYDIKRRQTIMAKWKGGRGIEEEEDKDTLFGDTSASNHIALHRIVHG
ncbi:hypothetical protein CT0861_05153 [Colletotrichum tofieldiae]|uniref:Uncharacterized protein n=1 Tax=Colletotrichum tofieldiae TaxID=708197 RepID=A0A166XVJ9_9PEZI|nr:hypothetical protein CT0861_05153 [Colletotrichum tofieldiae]